MSPSESAQYTLAFQHLINLQAQLLLESDDTGTSPLMSIYQVRQNIADTMADLLQSSKTQLSLFQAHHNQINKLQGRVDDIAHNSKYAIDLAAIGNRQTEISTEIALLESRLANLKKEQEKLCATKDSLSSIIDSRKSSYLAELQLLHKKDATLYSQETFEQVSREEQALEKGLVVWTSVCNELQKTESQMVELQHQREPLLEMLGSTLKFLTLQLDLAVKQNWSLLVVAISHEVQAVHNAISILQSQEKHE